LFARVPKRWMADVMHQGERFCQIGIQPQCRCDRARDLRNFYSVCKPIAEVIGTTISEDLRFIFQTPERAGMNDAIAIALKIRPIRMRGLWMAPSARFLGMERVGSVHGNRVALGSEHSAIST